MDRSLRFSLLLALLCGPMALGNGGYAADKHSSANAGIPANTGMYEKYRSEQQKFLDDFEGASPRLEADELLPVLFRTIQRLSRYGTPVEFPIVRRVPADALSRMACMGTCGVLGHYAGGREIYLDSRLTPETNLFDRSVLLHEMVHYLQSLQGEAPVGDTEAAGDAEKCRLWYTREREAYRIQESYLIMVSSPVRAGFFPARAPC